LSVWVAITIVITCIDLAIFILFAVDFGNIVERSRTVPMSEPNITWLAAQNVAGIMMTIALRGYLLWFINLVLAIYFSANIFLVYQYNKNRQLEQRNGFTNPVFVKGNRPTSEDMQRGRGPIDAFDEQYIFNLSFKSMTLDNNIF
jgi:hypothetical protein